ncbi:MAG: CCA tRNA nucleotidyltransferase [Candidatus Cloacimonadota bacterium]|nr:CCA tRNA nucleotidyltransferase [Candidatus Cloacimonadota bacterium]
MKTIIKLIAKAIKDTRFEHKTYIVGGFVRDKIMGKFSNDLDVVVDLQNGGIELADYLFAKRISSRPVIYKRFGTAMCQIAENKIEFVMARSESYQENSRKPEVKTGSIKEDVMRRDFTINSLVMDISTKKVFDLTGKGLLDIKDKIIRSTGKPDIIFGEDPLRMLRAVRFTVQLDFSVEQNTREGIEKNAPKLQKISWERKRDELNKILVSPEPDKGIAMLVELELMQYIIPEFKEILNVVQNKYHDKDVFHHTLDVLVKTPEKLNIRLAALLHDIGKGRTKTLSETGVHFYGHEKESAIMAGRILKRLKYSNREIESICFLIANHMRTKNFGDKAEKVLDKTVRKFILNTNENLNDLLNLIHADNLSHANEYSLPSQIPELKKRIKKLQSAVVEKQSPVSGEDIMEQFVIKEGLQVGKLKDEARAIWLEHPQWDKDEIIQKLKRNLEKN